MKKRKRSGIRRRYLKYTAALLGLALVLSILGVGAYVRERLTQATLDKYEFMTERMGIALENLFQKSDEAMEECILYDDVQESLKNQGLEAVNTIALSKYFAYIDLDHVADYCYIDNKGNVYSKSYSDVTSETIAQSGFEDYLGPEYSRTKWFWAKDTLFGTGDEALFIGRYVRSLDYAHEPGMLFFKMEDSFLDEITGMSQELVSEAVIGLVDGEGQLCLSWAPDGFQTGDEIGKMVASKIGGTQAAGMFLNGEKMQGGIVSAYLDENSGLTVFSFVPDSVLNKALVPVLLVPVVIYLFVIAIAVVLSIYFSRRFTKPIQVISDAMTGFDGNNFDRTIQLNTHTELDEIGQSYNAMLQNIRRLLEEIKAQEQELRHTELNMLISQINPHFLYNTLDTIYMLARINKEETTMRMIQALSKYLRLSLSKGSEIVTVEDELENVKSYMEIQQIRNQDLFEYSIDCQVDESSAYVLKLILQPLVENAVKYGFCDIFQGGIIKISVFEKDRDLYLRVYNNGTPMEMSVMEKINSMNTMSFSQLKECFPDKKNGYGVMNIMTRLRLKYGEGAGLFCEVYKDGTACTVKIPGGGQEDACEK